MFSNSQPNPLLARSRRTRGIVLSVAATFAILAAGTLAVSAQTPAKEAAQQVAQVTTQSAPVELRTTTSEPASQTRRQVRVIPLFNAPVNPTGYETK